MKALIAFPIAWFLYLLGDTAYRVLALFDDSEYWVAFWYPVYNNLMIAADRVQKWCGKYGPAWPWHQE